MSKREVLSLPERADAAFKDVCKSVIQRARQTGTPVITWRDGKVRKLTPVSYTHLTLPTILLV